MEPAAKLAILDFGSQYTHLLAARIRTLGAYCEIMMPDCLDAARARKEYAGLIYSGGPASVYDSEAPNCDERLSGLGLPILGICYGHQLLMQQNGAKIGQASNSEYGPAKLRILQNHDIFAGQRLHSEQTVWMSHGDEVQELPPGFEVLGKTIDCAYAAVGDCKRKLFGLQFHPEVRHSQRGTYILQSFIRLCGLEDSWKLTDFLQEEETRLTKELTGKKVFFLLSGGVDSTVAFALLARILDPKHLIGMYVDTGFMRHNEADEVKAALFAAYGIRLHMVDAALQFYTALKDVTDPEKKRQIIGELFIQVQQEASLSLGFDTKDWYLGQGTIYPDQIESGSSMHSHRIKTHHNRVAGIEALLQKGRVVEPISKLYKDEVRRLGAILGLPRNLMYRHPFPGPGLAVRCLCVGNEAQQVSWLQTATLQDKLREGWQDLLIQQKENHKKNTADLEYTILPVRSVGVQGDQRSYRHCLALVYSKQLPDWSVLLELATKIPNRFADLNRVLLHLGPVADCTNHSFILHGPASLSTERISLLRSADHIVSEFMREKNIYDEIWQFPVVLLPIAPTTDNKNTNAVVLRPVLSTDAMTASAYCMPPALLFDLYQRLIKLSGCSAVFYDLSNKPPGTIEWE